ncbi:MAG: LON peptidase substrate-binding domain-containing protein [Gammaproteobacteria bacterium]|nr:LON peptidase substrate-binding domain-containing protein [Gammaproteobacteria bacterium]
MTEIPLFPLPLVLCPGGRLPLQIFEPRYLDMIRRCLREDMGFGIIMIEEGEQVLSNREAQLPAVAHSGTLCDIVDFDQNPNGTLGIVVQGRRKFVVYDQYEMPDRLMMARVEFPAEEEKTMIPEEDRHLAELLGNFIEHEAVRALNQQIDFEDASEVGWRLIELLPCSNPEKQRLFEMKNPLHRLKELDRLLLEMQSG